MERDVQRGRKREKTSKKKHDKNDDFDITRIVKNRILKAARRQDAQLVSSARSLKHTEP